MGRCGLQLSSMWHVLKMRWYLRNKGNLYNEMFIADRQCQEKVSEMHQILNSQYFNPFDPDTEAKRTAAYFRTTLGAFRWITVGDVILCTKKNSVGRPYQVWLYNHRSRYGKLLFEEKNQSCTVDVAMTRDQEFVTINSNTRTSSEVRVLRANKLQVDCLLSNFQLVRKRQPRIEYYIDHAHGQFYVLSNNSENKEFKVMVGEDDTVDIWSDYYIPSDNVILQDMELYQKHVLLYGLRNLIPVAIVIDAHDRTKKPKIMYDDESCHMDKSHNKKFESDKFHFWLSSPVKPSFLLTSEGKQAVDSELKQTSTSSKKPMSSQEFTTRRFMAISQDGCAVPITVCYRTDLVKHDGNAPTLVHVYGSYGENIHMAYHPENQPLLDRGWVLVYCHIRGGGELGRKWYYDGIGENKYKGFLDLYACVDYVQSELNISRPELTALVGRSAGGLPVAMFCNLWPHKTQVALLQSPLVNLVYSLSESSSYLSIKDMEEFGGNTSPQQHLHSICPYCCLKPQDYPAMYIAASRHDEVIPFEGVEKYVDKLQTCIKQHKDYANHQMNTSNAHFWTKKTAIDRGTVLFNINCGHGHYYGSNKEKYREAAQQYSFLMKVLCCS